MQPLAFIFDKEKNPDYERDMAKFREVEDIFLNVDFGKLTEEQIKTIDFFDDRPLEPTLLYYNLMSNISVGEVNQKYLTLMYPMPISIMRILVHRGADVNHITEKGMTPLEYHCVLGYSENNKLCVELLLNQEIYLRPSLKRLYKPNAASLASFKHASAIVRHLLDRDIRIDLESLVIYKALTGDLDDEDLITLANAWCSLENPIEAKDVHCVKDMLKPLLEPEIAKIKKYICDYRTLANVPEDFKQEKAHYRLSARRSSPDWVPDLTPVSKMTEEEFKTYLDAIGDIDWYPPYGRPAVFSHLGYPDIVKLFTDHGADLLSRKHRY